MRPMGRASAKPIYVELLPPAGAVDARREGVMAADFTAGPAGRLPGGLRDSAVASAPYHSRGPPALDTLSTTTRPPLYEHTSPHAVDGNVPSCCSSCRPTKDGDR